MLQSAVSHCIVTPDIIGPIKNGGIGTACFHLANFLSLELGHHVTVLFTGPILEGTASEWESFYRKENGSRFTHLSPSTLGSAENVHNGHWFTRRSFAIHEWLKQQDFTHIHFQDMQANGFIPIQAKRTGMAYQDVVLTCTAHSSHQWIREGMRSFAVRPVEERQLIYCENYSLSHADVAVFPSRHMKQWLENKGVKPTKSRVIPYLYKNSSSLPTTSEESPRKIAELCFFGRLETRKGLEVFVDAIRLLVGDKSGVCLPKITFIGKFGTVGSGSAEEYIKQFAEHTGVNCSVLHDLDSESALRYLKADLGRVAVIPSLLDNLPYVVIECLQEGIPVLASNVGGVPELIGNEELLFEPRPAALAAALKRAITSGINVPRSLYDLEQAKSGWNEIASSSPLPAEKTRTEATNACICIAYYNYGKYLPELLKSLESQTIQGFGVVVVNDGSTEDYSNKVFQEMKARYADRSTWKFVGQENKGIGAARNHAASFTSAKFLIFMDADNIAESQMVQTMLRAMVESSADCLTCYMKGFQDCSATLVRKHVYSYTPSGGVVEAGLFSNCFGDANFIVRADVFKKLGGFSEDRTASFEDWEFLAHLCLEGYSLDVIPETLFLYRHSEAGFSRTTSLYANFMRIINRYKKYVPPWAGNIFEDVHLSINPDAETVARVGRHGLPNAIHDAFNYHYDYRRWSEETLDWHKQTLDWHKQTLDWYQSRNLELETDVAEMRGSLSWKVTRPIRIIARLLGLSSRN